MREIGKKRGKKNHIERGKEKKYQKKEGVANIKRTGPKDEDREWWKSGGVCAGRTQEKKKR